ncbi:hypothetical protein BS47DRAFT_1373890 [Hydnum rufescens UP504]|uniref:Syntaxin n=1 Tax=Hydnum rufescens UP504 TaxID=1448309 RepID=A0A9P6AKH2_9AGAM|nr:hypothetical protein BS47DRAFT_1373890 [Hydnum rufescens UP504]
MAAIQSIFIKDTEPRGTGTKTFIVYRITVQGAVRSWQIWRRYSEFPTYFHAPSPLPPKHPFAILPKLGRGNSEAVVEERRVGLEAYLRAILANKDPQWRDTFIFKDFLGVPVGKSDPSSFSWLDEHTDLQTLVRDVRADINKRDALSLRGDTSASHISNVQAKKKLAALVARLDVLGKGIQTLALAGMSEGEVQRRGDMVARLQDDCASLGKMVVAARQPTSAASLPDGGSRPQRQGDTDRNSATQVDRNALFSFPHMPSAFSGDVGAKTRPVTRIFGQKGPPPETERTRPLDNTGLVQLQGIQVDEQDAQLSQLTAILQRQKHLGLAINAEIEQQNELLDQLSTDVDRTGARLTSAKKQMDRLG